MSSPDQKTIKADELFLVVDENDQPLEPLPRKLVHGHGVWHRVAHVWLVNNKHEVLCQQRSVDKELNPGCWEVFLGGHMSPGESYEAGAMRELSEEAGIILENSALELYQVYKFTDFSGYNNEFIAIFICQWNGDISTLQFQDGEVAQTAWRSISDIREQLKKKADNWTFCGYELDALDYIETHYDKRV